MAAKQRENGATIEETCAYIEKERFHLCHYFTVEDLAYLKRGGRISGTVAVVGTLLNIKPVLHMDDEGHLISLTKVRGRKKSLDMLCDYMEKLATDKTCAYISHGDCMEDVEYVANQLRERFGTEEILVNDVDPVIGAHSGPGTLALFFVGEKR